MNIEDGKRRSRLGQPQPVHPPAMDVRTDLGPLGDGPVQLFAPPALLPVPVELIPDGEWVPPHPVVVGAPTAAGWRYDCIAVTRRGVTDLGTLEIGVSFEGEYALAGIETEVDSHSRPPRYWWVPAAQVWIERPLDDPPPVRPEPARSPPNGPPLRMLTRATDADRVIGRHGWLARRSGWVPVVAVTDPWTPDAGPIETRERPRLPSPVLHVNVVPRRLWYRWGVIGDVNRSAVVTVQASGVWLE